MANRRKFIAGLGALATGSAAAMGTGAFSSVRAERAISVETAGDVNAYLGLDASESVYAEQTGSTLELQFDGSNSGQDGNGLNANADSGLNANADSVFQNVFSIKNNGQNTVRVQVYPGGELGDLPNGPMAVYHTEEESTNVATSSLTAFNTSPVPDWHDSDYGRDTPAIPSSQDLAPGDDIYVHFAFYLNDSVESLGSDASTNISDIPNTLGIYADATPEEDNEAL